MKIELVYEQTCPHIAAARTRLMRAFQHAGLVPRWSEWDVGLEDTPERVRRYGSPTVLVDGKDVVGEELQASGGCCRLYPSGSGFESVPPLDRIVRALRQAAEFGGTRRWGVSIVPSVGVALLPKLTCPLCWPAYTALLSTAGIGFIDYTPYLLPLTTVFLAITLWALGYRAQLRRGFGPFWLGVLGSISIVAGKFILENQAGLYVGVAILLGASLWNIWPQKMNRRTCRVQINRL